MNRIRQGVEREFTRYLTDGGALERCLPCPHFVERTGNCGSLAYRRAGQPARRPIWAVKHCIDFRPEKEVTSDAGGGGLSVYDPRYSHRT